MFHRVPFTVCRFSAVFTRLGSSFSAAFSCFTARPLVLHVYQFGLTPTQAASARSRLSGRPPQPYSGT